MSHEFQSTLPTRGSDGMPRLLPQIPKISIHAPHEGERPTAHKAIKETDFKFQSTLPTRGSDVSGTSTRFFPSRFQSTLPTRGSDRHPTASSIRYKKFQSTLPTRGSDCVPLCICFCWPYFNPRSPRGGATSIMWSGVRNTGENFNPRSPRGGATRGRPRANFGG